MLLSVRQIGHTFAQIPVLDGISFEVDKQQIFGVFGSSGAGKTTLLKIISSLLRPTTGQVYFHGESIFDLSNQQLDHFRNRKIGFIDQSHWLFPELSVEENVVLPFWILCNNTRVIPSRVYELLDYLGLSGFSKAFPHMLSGGQQQRVVIARALMNHPDLIFADEPTGNLDSGNAEQISSLFFQLMRDFRTSFVIVTHNSEWQALIRNHIVLKDGKIAKHVVDGPA